MASILFVNDFRQQLAASVAAIDTTITLNAAPGLTNPTGGDYYVLAVYKSGAFEIMHVTGVSGAVLTVTRGQEGTTATTFNVNDIVELPNTAGIYEAMLQKAAASSTLLGDLIVQGAVQVQGATMQVSSQVTLADAMVVLRYGASGAPAAGSQTGHKVDRGTSLPYASLFDENTTSFRVGLHYDTVPYSGIAGGPFTVGELVTGGTSGAVGKIVADNTTSLTLLTINDIAWATGESITGSTSGASATTGASTRTDDTQPVATREDTPTADTIAIWDTANKRFTTAGSKTLTQLETDLRVPAGVMMAYGGTTAPSGWLLCDGSAVSRTTYATLFAAISTTYGVGDGATTFNLPDKRGRVSVGKDAGTFATQGATGGAETHTLAESEMPGHTHVPQTKHVSIPSETINAGPGYGYTDTAANARATSATSSTGGGGAHNNLQPYEVDLWIIKT